MGKTKIQILTLLKLASNCAQPFLKQKYLKGAWEQIEKQRHARSTNFIIQIMRTCT